MLNRIATTVATLALSAVAFALPQPGDPAPPITLTDITNAPPDSPRTLQELRGKVVILEFWATWCGPCIAAIPHLNELQASFADRDDLAFLAVTDEAPTLTNTFIGSRDMRAPIGHDDDGKTFRVYGVRSIPRTIVIDREGIVIGVLSPRQLTKERLQGYLDGQMDRRQTFETAQQEEIQDRFERLSREASGVIPGADPLSAVPELLPQFQIIVRKNPHGSGLGGRTQSATTLTRVRPRALLATLSSLSPGRIEFPAGTPERDDLYDLVVRWPRGVPSESLRIAAAILAAQALGYNAEFGEFDTVVYRLGRTASPSIDLRRTDDSGGYSWSVTEFESVEGTEVPSLVSVLELSLRRPIVDETSLEGYFVFPPITFTEGSLESVNDALRAHYGLELVLTTRRIKLLRLTP